MEIVQPIRSKQQIEAIKKILKGSNLRDYCLFTLGINSALRISDLVKLKISDVLDEKQKVKSKIELREKKTNKSKFFPISSSAKKAIETYLKSRRYRREQPLFLSQKQGAISRVQAYRIIRGAAQNIGIKKIGTHSMRKTFGYHAYKEGVDISLLQKLLNHSSPSVTLEYIGITQSQIDDVYLNLNL